jgi:hypothetical protein
MKKFVGSYFLVSLLLGACAKPKCPTYMTPQEFARYESERCRKVLALNEMVKDTSRNGKRV